MIHVLTIFGTRPEAIKLAPVVRVLENHPAQFHSSVCVTAQHREMLDQVLEVFEIKPDADLDLMQRDQTLAELTARAIEAVDHYLATEEPELVLVQGDTTTVFCAALAAFYRHIPVGHVEAGLRTGNLQSPWPEEANRVLASRLVTLHFAPTETARQNLLREGVPDERIFVTGNTVIDALFLALDIVRKHRPRIPSLPDFLQPTVSLSEVSSVPASAGGGPVGRDFSVSAFPVSAFASSPRLVLITGHRRENFGEGFENICRAIAELAARFPDVHFVYPVHLNPNVREPVRRILGGLCVKPETGSLKPESGNVHLIEPLAYLPFVALMNRATLILTDSGGVQEEAPSLGKPVLVMRETTERPEAVQAGTARLVGTAREAIVTGVTLLLTDAAAYSRMQKTHNPYGDGTAASRIKRICHDWLRHPKASRV